jgi:hypothetical protein
MFVWNMKPKTQTLRTLELKPQILNNSWTEASNSKEISNSKSQDSSLKFQELEPRILRAQDSSSMDFRFKTSIFSQKI